MQTEIVEAQSAVARAVELLRSGEVVALPTETVYGLAADATNPTAVAKIFAAKERPRFDPLIVHLPARDSLDAAAQVKSDLVSSLIDRFWPGPLTIILRKRETIPDIVTAGLQTVALRMSAHPVFHQIIRAFGRPLAAPSANRFGRISPTSAQHVYDELADRIPLIVDGGATTHGVESTIVQIVDGTIEILRAGPITAEMLGQFARVRTRAAGDRIIAPGQLPSHYAPRTKLILVDDPAAFQPPESLRIAALCFRPLSRAERSEVEGSRRATSKFTEVRELTATGDLAEAAANVFRLLRELDALGLDLIVAEKVPHEGIGIAINDRLQRAAASA
ncbi:MAG: threonylcarbamoyl-AMP synthase [Chthoniobacterales bacterium]|nr:MAG: threonylcarbamoyl-AMP synthase [Chthoniobacterales bacterium]